MTALIILGRMISDETGFREMGGIFYEKNNYYFTGFVYDS